MRIRMVAWAAAAVALTGGAFVTGAGAANAAAPTPHMRMVHAAAGNYWDLVIYNGSGQNAGMAQWSQDPQDGNPGDALRAYDNLSDGYGIHAYLDDGRMASTGGHSAPYWSGWATGNLTEGTSHRMTVCMEKSGVDYACVYHSVTA